jgi:hypothetical protein
MHSGSHALWYGIFRHHHPVECPKPGHVVPESCILLDHITDQAYESKWKGWIAEGHPIVTMMRHPARCMASHIARNEVDTRWMMWYASQWMNHMELWREHTPYVIHLDQPELRDRQLQIINDELGTNLNYDWRISQRMGCKHNTHDKKVDEVLKRMIPQRFNEYYEETVDAYKAKLY